MISAPAIQVAMLPLKEGLIIAVMGYVIVFSALLGLFLVFNNIPKLINIQIRKKLKEKGKKECCDDSELMVPGEVSAAISMSLFLYFYELHDQESNVLTIKKVSRTYSPWSSKIYGLRNYRRP
jgi:hypothetical protein